MFHELSLRKIVSMSVLALTLAFGISLFTYLEVSTHMVERTWQFLERGRSDVLYSLVYDGPWNQTAAVAAVRPTQNARAIPVLLYHGTPSEGNDNPPLPQNVFVDQMRALKADGWNTITLAQFTDFMKNGTPLPAKSFLLTFDDARKESFYPADPVLKELGYNAVMFVITGFSLPDKAPKGSSYYLDKTELEYMAQSGRWELESHGNMDHALYDVPSATSTDGVATIKDQHFLSNKFWLEDKGRMETEAEYTTRITNDLAASKQILENDFNTPISAYAYPFDDYGQNTVNFSGSRSIIGQVVSELFTFAFYQINPIKEDPFNYPDPKAVNIKRIEPVASWSGADLVALMDGADAKTLPFSVTHFNAWEWGGNWGQVSAQSGTLMLSATPNTSGAVALLNGSRWWKNYQVTATIGQKNGNATSLIARYTGDSDTFLSCAFQDDHVDLQAHENGKQTTLASAPYIQTPGATLSMSVLGTEVSCSGYGQTAQAIVNPSYVHPGSVGIQVWGKTVGTESLQVDSVSVKAL